MYFLMFNTMSEDYENVFYFLMMPGGANWFVKMFSVHFVIYIYITDQLSQDKVRFLQGFLT